MTKNIVNIEWLHENIADNIRIVDCRFALGDATKGFEDYLAGHIPHAIYFDLERDLSGSISVHGGRHPLPEIDELVAKLSAAGIDAHTTVVAYDDQGGAFASRLWWLLQYLGHEKNYLLDGGYSNWVNKGLAVSMDIPTIEHKSFEPTIQKHLVADVDDVRKAIGSDIITIIDSREENRYLGIEEPIDKVAGHIPTAKSKFWKAALNNEGKWSSPTELQAKFSNVNKDNQVIVYCGSGVTACPNVLALKEAEYDNVKLYVGSWSDWITYPDNPIETVKIDQ